MLYKAMASSTHNMPLFWAFFLLFSLFSFKLVSTQTTTTAATTVKTESTTTDYLTPETPAPVKHTTPNWAFFLWQMRCKRDCVNRLVAGGYSVTR